MQMGNVADVRREMTKTKEQLEEEKKSNAKTDKTRNNFFSSYISRIFYLVLLFFKRLSLSYCFICLICFKGNLIFLMHLFRSTADPDVDSILLKN